MTDTLRKAAELALETLNPHNHYDIIEALRTALAEKPDEVEPICYLREEWLHYEQSAEGQPGAFPVFTSPPAATAQIAELEETLRLQRNAALADRAQITKLEQKLAIAEKSLNCIYLDSEKIVPAFVARDALSEMEKLNDK